ncbi:CheR family methyltransferase [Idiomarina baltica]|uniref:CheR family methyltransferase n=1 Tax=Idiomarina baltica TaxID=190892 RepID=UPI002352AD1B|nr:CheR family methyltransferase [Idiomarina baltica]|tara:strand:+ start:335 stop:1171 length:837 start_codon:yes stop_codon:yes gene_type:complete
MSLAKSTADTLTPTAHQKLARFIDTQVGIQLPAHKKSLIEARLRKLQARSEARSLSDYIDYVTERGTQDDVLSMIDALTTNKTGFFREPAHFKVLTDQLPRLVQKGRPLRIWSAGCSSGEEPYTIAMVMEEFARQHGDVDYQITATDISKECLFKAQRGIYPSARIEPVSETLRKRYLLRSKDSSKQLIKVSDALRRRVSFSDFNFITGDFSQFKLFDVIFCRNVMIYFDAAQRARLLNLFRQQLVMGGVFFLGLSEGISAERNQFEQLSPSAYKRVI